MCVCIFIIIVLADKTYYYSYETRYTEAVLSYGSISKDLVKEM